MKILITGVTGFAGTHLVNLLAEDPRDFDLWGTYRHSGRKSLLEINKEIKLLECDVNYFQSVEHVVESVMPDLIFHFAAYVSVAKSFEHPALTFQTNVIGTINFLEVARKVCKDAKILIPGSAEAYGKVEQANIPIKEAQELHPQNPYGLSKVAQEMLGMYYFRTFGLNVYLTRTFHYTGPGQSHEFVCSDFAKQIANIEKGKQNRVIKVGNLDTKRDFLDIRDVVRAYWEIIEKGDPGVPYNVCKGKSMPIKKILNILLEETKLDISVETDKDKLRPADVPDFVGDNIRLKKDTSWMPRVEMEETLKAVLNFWRVKLDVSR